MRILLPYCSGVRSGTFYQDFYEGVTEALRELGHVAVPFSFATIGQASQEEMQALYRLLQGSRCDAVFDLCCWSYGLSQFGVAGPHGEQTPIFDALGLAYVGMLFDQPYFQAINAIRAGRLYATYPDKGHREQARLVFPQLALAGEIFVPPAIRPANDCSAPDCSDRAIEVLYVGNLHREALERLWSGSQYAYACDAVADAALDDPDRSLHLSVKSALDQIGALPDGFDFAAMMRAVEFHLRAKFRLDAVAALARSGVRMRVVGRGWEAIELPGNVQLDAETDYRGLFRLAGQSRICLDASTYWDGVNDRVFSYALSRAVCFTNAAGYLRAGYGERKGVCFYSMRDLDCLGDQVRTLLAQPERLRETGEQARQSVLQSQTWRHRLGDILGAVRS